MWKYLFAILVSIAVIVGGRYFYHHRHDLFRPDFDRSGGTLLVFETDGEPSPGRLDELVELLQKRFDPGGGEGLVFRVDEEGRIEVGVPNGKQHDDLVDSVKRLAARPGVVEFRVTATRTEDDAVFKASELPMKSAKLDVPPSPPVNAHGGEEFPLARPIGTASRYRWVRLSEGQVKSLRLDRLGLMHESPLDRAKVDDSVRKGVPFSPTYMMEAFLQARVLAPGTDPAFFMLVREPGQNDDVRMGALESVRVNGGRGRASVSFRLNRQDAGRVSELRQNNALMPGGSMYWKMMILLDGESLGAPMMSESNRREVELLGDYTLSEAEDLVVLLRGGPLPCRLKSTPPRDISVGKKK
jgi:hypothetical protein